MHMDPDQIIIDDLKEAYRLNAIPNTIDCSDDVIEPDYEFLYCIRRVLEYYMTPKQYEEWCEQITEEEK